MKSFVAPEWIDTLRANSLLEFEDLWRLDIGWFEPPNRRRGGWSGVSRCRVRLADGGNAWLFLKRQENHVHRTLLHPWRGMATFVREMRSIQRYRKSDIPALEPVLFLRRQMKGRQQAVLITEELRGFQSLREIQSVWDATGWPPRGKRLAVAFAVADLLARMHERGLQHNCFYPKHVFLRQGAGGWEARVIDLEKTKRPLLRRLTWRKWRFRSPLRKSVNAVVRGSSVRCSSWHMKQSAN